MSADMTSPPAAEGWRLKRWKGDDILVCTEMFATAACSTSYGGTEERRRGGGWTKVLTSHYILELRSRDESSGLHIDNNRELVACWIQDGTVFF